jgi:hypothetical protein
VTWHLGDRVRVRGDLGVFTDLVGTIVRFSDRIDNRPFVFRPDSRDWEIYMAAEDLEPAAEVQR